MTRYWQMLPVCSFIHRMSSGTSGSHSSKLGLGRKAWPQELWPAHTSPPLVLACAPASGTLGKASPQHPQPTASSPGWPPLVHDPKVRSPAPLPPRPPVPDGEGHSTFQGQSVGHHHSGGQTHWQHVGERGQQVPGLHAGLQQGCESGTRGRLTLVGRRWSPGPLCSAPCPILSHAPSLSLAGRCSRMWSCPCGCKCPSTRDLSTATTVASSSLSSETRGQAGGSANRGLGLCRRPGWGGPNTRSAGAPAVQRAPHAPPRHARFWPPTHRSSAGSAARPCSPACTSPAAPAAGRWIHGSRGVSQSLFRRAESLVSGQTPPLPTAKIRVGQAGQAAP